MSVNIVNQDGSLKKIAHGFPESKFNALLNDVVQYVETGDTASRDYAVGDVFMTMNGQLVRAINAIEEDTAISASDVEEVSVTELIAEHTEKLDNISDGANKVESSTTNGNIKIDGTETPVYRLKGNNTVLATDKTPFLLRQVPTISGASVYVREKLVGASYAWNNLANVALTQATVINNVTCTPNSDGSITLNGTTNTSGALSGTYNAIPVIAGHKYLLFAIGTAVTKGITLYTNIGGNTVNNYFIRTSETSGNFTLALRSDNNKAYSNDKVWVVCCDLTLAFGSTIADYLYGLSDNGGITLMRQMGFPIDKYTAYGNYLVSSRTSGKKIRGFNQWDGKYSVNDKYISSSGEEIANDQWNITSYMPIIPGVTYFFKNLSGTSSACIGWYDVKRNFISATAIADATFTDTAPINAKYLRCSVRKVSSDTCINISDPDKNGTYESYSRITYSLGNDELRGKFDLVNSEIIASGDVKESNGEITRVRKRIELNSIDWTYDSTNSRFVTVSAISDIKVVSNTDVASILSSKYVTVAFNSLSADKSLAEGNNSKIYIKDSAYTDATTFKTAMSGVYMEYELATPTTEQSTPFADPMSLNGATTEEYVDDRTIPVPVGHETQYMGQSEDVVEIPSMPLADGDSVLHCQKSGNEAQYYWESQHMYYKEWVAVGDGTTTYGDLLTQLKPYYEALSEDEKTYSKIMIRANNPNSNECLSFVGAYWYSRVGLSGTSTFSTWFSMVSLENCTYKTLEGDTSWNNTNVATSNSIALRTVTTVRET